MLTNAPYVSTELCMIKHRMREGRIGANATINERSGNAGNDVNSGERARRAAGTHHSALELLARLDCGNLNGHVPRSTTLALLLPGGRGLLAGFSCRGLYTELADALECLRPPPRHPESSGALNG